MLVGPAVERIALLATKDDAGELATIDVEITISEALDEATVAGGIRLLAFDQANVLLRTSPERVEPVDAFTMRLRFSGEEWTAFTEGAALISTAVTGTARASAWSSTQPVLPAPGWVQALGRAYSSAAAPVEVRDSLASLASWLASIPAGAESDNPLYSIEDPALLAAGPESDSIIRFLTLSPFQALPFIDSVTGHSLARRRWLDHTTGTFLTPDPLGFIDSPNLYAYAGGDPVNGRDPRGKMTRSQLQRIVQTANRMSKGMFGEQALEKILVRSGRIVLDGPSHGKRVNAPGADVISFNPVSGRIELWDHKFFTTTEWVTSVPTFTRPERRAANRARAYELVLESDLPNKETLLAMIDAGDVDYVVGSVGPFNKVRRLSSVLEQKGIILGRRAYIHRTGQPRSRRYADRLLKAVPLVSFAMHVPDLSAAAREDRFVTDVLEMCDTCDIPFSVRHAGMIEVAGRITGEEVGGDIGCAGGATLAGFASAPSGPGALAAAVGGCVSGGLFGDSVGGSLGHRFVENILLRLVGDHGTE